MAKIGFLGLGAMGLPMAKRLLAAGHTLQVATHSNPAPVRELEAAGAKAVKNAAEVVSGVDCVVSILPEDPHILAVLLAPDVMNAVPKNAVIIEMSTASAETVRRVADEYAAKGVRVLDAPVSGGVEGAVKGTLTIMCGGDAAVLDTVRPVLEAMGKNIRLVGTMGAGKNFKALNNLMSAVNVAVVAETLQIARKLGLDPDTVYDIVSSSSGQSSSFDSRFKRMVDENFDGGFKLWLMMKDMRIALKDAAGLSMPLSTLAYQIYEMADPADKDIDFSAVSRVYPGNRKKP